MIDALLLACAPNIAPATLEAVIRVESGGNPLAINVNGVRVQPPPATSAAEAARIAESYILRGYSVDVGLMQVNSRNLVALGMTVERVLDPCTNIRSGAAILAADYAEAARLQHGGLLSGFRERLRGPLLRPPCRADSGERGAGRARRIAAAAESLHGRHLGLRQGGGACRDRVTARVRQPCCPAASPT
jgi:hypothetical protein